MADIAKKRLEARVARHSRIRKKMSGTAERPRLCVRRTLRYMVAQIIDDDKMCSLLQLNSADKEFQKQHGELNKTEQSRKLGALIAEQAKAKGIQSVVFDRGGYIYHGRVQALADGAREAGLEF
ncbi:MAG TPA: 50S ribosomal protein L18 [Fibrobacteraceae bacterium]|nr:50S ribosomal protein L18 [Fibrobacteraceae bacterium]